MSTEYERYDSYIWDEGNRISQTLHLSSKDELILHNDCFLFIADSSSDSILQTNNFASRNNAHGCVRCVRCVKLDPR